MSTILTGVLFATLAALGYALWNLYMQKALLQGAEVAGYLFALSLTMTVLYLPIALWQYTRGSIAPLQPDGLLSFVLAGLVTGAIAPFHSTMATRMIGAAQTTAIRLLDPFFAFVMGVLFLHERIAGTAIAGVALIAVGLAMLQASQRRPEVHEERGRVGAGLLFAIGASILYTLGSALRKSGLAAIPSPILSVALEGLVGLVCMAVVLTSSRRWVQAKQILSPKYLDVWLSALASALATLALNLALQRLALPVSVALRNTSPWFALLLAPVLLGGRHRPGKMVWGSTLFLSVGMLLILMR